MSTCQLKKTFTSAEPRPVAERTNAAPGTSFMTSSTGLVMAAIISSAGMTPLSIRMMHRGKSVCGNTGRHSQRGIHASEAQDHRDEHDGGRILSREASDSRTHRS